MNGQKTWPIKTFLFLIGQSKKKFPSETALPVETKLCRNGVWKVPCIQNSHFVTMRQNMAAN